MPRFRKMLAAATLALLIAFTGSLVEWHSDHEACGSSANRECGACCIQCCPSHHLPPCGKIEIVVAVPQTPNDALTSLLKIPSDLIPQLIERPPIT